MGFSFDNVQDGIYQDEHMKTQDESMSTQDTDVLSDDDTNPLNRIFRDAVNASVVHDAEQHIVLLEKCVTMGQKPNMVIMVDALSSLISSRDLTIERANAIALKFYPGALVDFSATL
tara:strand:- start:24525 stop:24875 length:351 start_codon:yes stop_codon:yes gene_type:complete